jgi:CxxC motif-containing protein (DUF1111 family)
MIVLITIAGMMLTVSIAGRPSSALRPQPVASPMSLGSHFPGLTPALVARFDKGQQTFEHIVGVSDGLGPVFNDVACVACHGSPAPGGSSATLVTRFGLVNASGTFDPLAPLGGSLLQAQAIPPTRACALAGEQVPPAANRVAQRRSTTLFGLGLVDALPASTFDLLALVQPLPTRGHVSRVLDPDTGQLAVGRFGWKAQGTTLHAVAGAEYRNQMGVTSQAFAAEECPQGDCAKVAACDLVSDPEADGLAVGELTDFMRLLAPPPPPKITDPVGFVVGGYLFGTIGCGNCHWPGPLVTGPSRFAALDRVPFLPFSDFLLHDMGSLADGIGEGTAAPNEMRTAPLWGVSAQPFYLHDGSAATLDEAILAHDGQGASARDKFAALTVLQRARLMVFLKAL